MRSRRLKTGTCDYCLKSFKYPWRKNREQRFCSHSHSSRSRYPQRRCSKCEAILPTHKESPSKLCIKCNEQKRTNSLRRMLRRQQWASDRDVVGKSFHRLTIHRELKKGHPRAHRKFECVCTCGGRTTAYLGDLKTGQKKSCGCLQREVNARRCSATREASRRWVVLGERLSSLEVATLAGISRSATHVRLMRGESPVEIITQSIRKPINPRSRG